MADKLKKTLMMLIADDDQDDQMIVKSALADLEVDVKIYTVNNGQELLDYLFCRGEYSDPEISSIFVFVH